MTMTNGTQQLSSVTKTNGTQQWSSMTKTFCYE